MPVYLDDDGNPKKVYLDDDGEPVRTNLLNQSGLTGAEVKRRAAAGEEILQEGLRPGSDAEQVAVLVGKNIKGIVKGTAELGGLIADAVRLSGPGGAFRARADPLKLTRKAGEIVQKGADYVAEKTGTEGVAIGPAGEISEFMGEIEAPGPEAAVAFRRAGKVGGHIDNLIGFYEKKIASAADEATRKALREELDRTLSSIAPDAPTVPVDMAPRNKVVMDTLEGVVRAPADSTSAAGVLASEAALPGRSVQPKQPGLVSDATDVPLSELNARSVDSASGGDPFESFGQLNVPSDIDPGLRNRAIDDMWQRLRAGDPEGVLPQNITDAVARGEVTTKGELADLVNVGGKPRGVRPSPPLPENVTPIRATDDTAQLAQGGGAGDPPPPPTTPPSGPTMPQGDDAPIVPRQPTDVRPQAGVDPPFGDGFDAPGYAQEMRARREAARGQDSLSFSKFMADAKANVVDSNAPIEDAVRRYIRGGAVEGGAPPVAADTTRALLGDTLPRLPGETVRIRRGALIPSEDITNAIDRSIMSGEIASQFMKDRGLHETIKAATDITELEEYAIAKHAITLFYQRWGKNVDRVADPGARPRKLVEIYQKRFGRDLVKDARYVKTMEGQYEPLAQQLHDYSRELLDYSVDSGLVPRDVAEHLKATYPYYVPLQRVFSVLEENADELAHSAGGGPASLSRQNFLRKFEGSERAIESPVESLIGKTYDVFAQGERNKAAKLLASYRTWDGNPLQIRELKSTERATHTFSYVDDGVKRSFETTPEIAAAAKAMNAEQMGMLGRMLAVPARVLKVGATGLNLAFLARNPVRDVVTAVINSEAGLRVVREVGQSIFEAVRHGDLYDEIMREGGMFTSVDQFRAAGRHTVPSIRGERGFGESGIKYTARRANEFFRAVEDVVSRGEQFARIAVYRAEKARSLAKGLPEAEARISAKRASLWTTGPFHRQGNWGRVLRASAPYLNAGIQGQRVTVSALKNNPVGTFTKLTATTLTPVAIATAWNLSDERMREAYAQHSEFEKENNILILAPEPMQDENGLWNTIKIPLPQSVAKWATLLRRPLEAAAGLDPLKFGEISQALLGTVSPVSSPAEAGSNVVPQAVKPILEVGLDKNSFTRRDIVGPFRGQLPLEERVGPRTSGTARLISAASEHTPFEATTLAPLQVDHLIRGYTGGLGVQATNAMDQALAATGAIPEEQIGGEGPLAMTKRGFYGAVPQPAKTTKEDGPTGAKPTKVGPQSSFGHDEAVEKLRLRVPPGSAPEVAAQIAGGAVPVYINPDGERIPIPAGIRNAFANNFGTRDGTDSPISRWLAAMVKQKRIKVGGTLVFEA